MADTASRILDAALKIMAAHGLARLSLEDVARESGLSRQTIYRYFGSRDALVAAGVLREEERFIAAMRRAGAQHADLRPALEAAIAAALRLARDHPLLDRLLATEPEALLPFLTTGAGPVLSAGRPVLEELLTTRLPHLAAPRVHRVADMLSRLLVSYAINPPDADPDEVAAGVAGILIEGLKAEG